MTELAQGVGAEDLYPSLWLEQASGGVHWSIFGLGFTENLANPTCARVPTCGQVQVEAPAQ